MTMKLAPQPNRHKLMISLLSVGICSFLLLNFRYHSPQLKGFVLNYERLEADHDTSQSLLFKSYQRLRNTANDLKNFWLYFRSTVNKTQYRNQLKTIDDGYASINARLSDVMQKSAEPRKNQLRRVAEFVRQEIEKLQNPRDCSQTAQLVREISTLSCGFGCTLHAVVGGLLQAFVENRTFILRSENWKYAKEGWEYAFLPLTKCKFDGDVHLLPTAGSGERVLRADKKLAEWFQWRVPRGLQLALEKLHGQPYVWWIGQLTAYATRLQPFLDEKLRQLAQEIGFTDSAFGIQVRWGDKLQKSAEKHEVEEYMLFVETWLQQLKNRGQSVERVIYLATEEKEVWRQMRRKYPKYKFIGNLRSTEVTAPKFRYKHQGLVDVITDIHFLSRCSYIVCTLSSNVCRAAYELMMNLQDDASTRVISLDSIYRLKKPNPQPWVAVMDHDPAWYGELEMKKGDRISISWNAHLPFNDGYFRGLNERTGNEGKIPTYKVREERLDYNMSRFHGQWYSEINL